MLYFIKGTAVPREQALKYFQGSRTYRMAARADGIFSAAERGDDTNGAIAHLREARIEIVREAHEQSQPDDADADGGK